MTTEKEWWVLAYNTETKTHFVSRFDTYYLQGQNLISHRMSVYTDYDRAVWDAFEANSRVYDIYYHDIGGYHITHRNNSIKHPNPLLISCNHSLEEAEKLTEKYDNQHTRLFVVAHHDGNGVRWSDGYCDIVAFRFDSYDEDDYGLRKPHGDHYTDVSGPFESLAEAQAHKREIEDQFNSYYSEES